MFLKNDCHFGRHLGFMKKLQRHCQGLSVCYSTHIYGAILKNSASYEKCSPFDQLQSVLNADARLIGGINKFGHISEFIRVELHWLPMHRRIAFKILMLMRNCLSGQAPVYLRELCVPVSSLPGRRSLRSAEQGDLVVPRVRLATAQRRSFAVVGPSFWN